MAQLRNSHPGEILKEEFLNEIGMSQNQLAHAIGVPGNRIHAIVNGTRDITGDTDLRLCKFFGLWEGYFLRLQNAYDTMEAKRRIAVGRQDQAVQPEKGGLKHVILARFSTREQEEGHFIAAQRLRLLDRSTQGTERHKELRRRSALACRGDVVPGQLVPVSARERRTTWRRSCSKR